MGNGKQPTTTGAHLIASLETVEGVVRSKDSEELKAIRQGAADECETIFNQLHSMSKEERETLLQGAASMRKRLQECATLYDEYEEQLESDFQSLLDDGYTESDLAGLILPPAEWVAKQLQGEAGNCPVGENLTKQLRSSAPKKQSVRVTSQLTGMTESQVRNRRDGKGDLTVNEAARFAVAYGITTGELLGIVDADEVILLKLWRGMNQSKREALLCLLS